jgi:hypothetical protein
MAAEAASKTCFFNQNGMKKNVKYTSMYQFNNTPLAQSILYKNSINQQ